MKRILVAKLRELGDVLLSGPVFYALKRAYPEAEIDGYIYREGAPLLEGHPAVHELIFAERKKKLWNELSLLRDIRRRRYDMVINLTSGDRGAIMALVSGAKVRVGWDSQGEGFLGKDKIYTHLIRNCPHPKHRVEKDLDAVRVLGIDPPEEDRELFFKVPDEIVIEGEYVVVHPLSRCAYKCLRPDVWKEVIQTLISKGHRVVVTGASHEKEAIQKILAGNEINLVGKLSLSTLGGVIARARVLLCVDSMPMHLAAAVKTPLVAVFGPSSEVNWGPWRHPRAEIVTLNYPCRPCYQAGCGGSGLSDCLLRTSASSILRSVSHFISVPINSCQ